MTNRTFILSALAAAALLLPALPAEARKKPAHKAKSEQPAKSDTTRKDTKKGYAELLKGATTDKGLFDLHRKGTDLWFEIPDSILGRDILIVNKISGVPYLLNDAGINKGMGFGEKIVRFRKDTVYKKVWVATYDPRITSPEGDAITRSVRDNYRESIIEQFPIEAWGKDSASVVIKANKVFDGSEKSFNNVFKALSMSASARKELSRIESARSFPGNVVVKSALTTVHTEGDASAPLTVEITSNLVLLPREPMRPRFADDRVGYFTIGHLYFNDRQQKAEERELVNRWRLEPRPEDVERYKRGELVEPAKPIVLWIDPATPPVWVPYIKKGIVEWQEAFEEAGFKNAIQAREVDPARDTDFDVDDVRYSVVTYAASEMANAMGPSVIDPRSGEIIEADIIWWHNVMSVLHAWIRLQTGAVDPAARHNELPTELMGNAVRFVSSHELGHSLGLKHNFGSSFAVPVDSLRSVTYTSTRGTAPSIMDYARFNYVAQPEDGIAQLTPKIGVYDKHAIRWGYRWLDVEDPHEELPTLNAWLREHENDPEYWYGEQSGEGIDPRSQSEDLGDDAVRASLYGLANLKRIIPHVADWTAEEGKLQFEAGRFLLSIVFQWAAYADHVKTNVGGFYLNNVVSGQELDRYVPVPADRQRKSVGYLIDQVFITPQWLFGAEAWDRSYPQRTSPVGQMEYSPYNFARELQYKVYYDLLKDERLLRMYEVEARQGRGPKTYTPEQMLDDITRAVFLRHGGRTLSIWERMSQKNYIDALIVSSNITMVKTTKLGSTLHESNCVCRLMQTAPEPEMERLPRPEELGVRTVRNYTMMQRVSETASVKRAELRRLLGIVRGRLESGDQATRNHYRDLELRLREALRMI
ncbi:zinc-dependent metalloprotease [Alistipes sp.]|uniref:zinc-dependent metalloprotease n=1 Tax=Alistipes sp. TaxID=1872444 RepID=UPI003AF15ADD